MIPSLDLDPDQKIIKKKRQKIAKVVRLSPNQDPDPNPKVILNLRIEKDQDLPDDPEYIL